nr:NfeD family protein [Actinomycetales bacterium]
MAWILWLIGAIVAAIVEMFTLDFVFLMFAGGALGGMIAALAGGSVWVQMVAFGGVSLLLLFLVRPAAQAWMLKRTPEARTNVRALSGRIAEVLTEVTTRGGRVKLAGEVWSARSSLPEEVFREGQSVVVVEIDGAFAVVTRAEQPSQTEYPTF